MSSWLIALSIALLFYCLGFLMGFWRLQENQRRRVKNISFVLVPNSKNYLDKNNLYQR